MSLNRAYFSHLDDYLTDPPLAAYEIEADYLRQLGRIRSGDPTSGRFYARARAFERTARRIRWARQARLARMQREAA